MRPIAILKIGSRSSSSSGYGGGSLDTQTVTTGSTGSFGFRHIGFITGTIGSVSDGTSNLYAGAAIREIASEGQGVGDGFNILFTVTGVVANSGWTSMNIGGNFVITRASATFSTAGGNSTWTWANAGQPFSGTVIVGFD